MFDVARLRSLVVSGCCAIAFGVSGAAAATFVPDASSYDGNGCTGNPSATEAPGLVRANGFGGCTLDGSLVIGKFDFNDAGEIMGSEWGTFGDLSSRFSFSLNNDGTGSFSYNPAPDEPGITGFYVKGGPAYNVYRLDGQAFLGIGVFDIEFTTPINPNNNQRYGLSNIAFFDSLVPIPLPAAGWLLLTALGGLGAAGIRRRRKAA